MAIPYLYGHHHHKVDLLSGRGDGRVPGRDGAPLESLEVGGVAQGDPGCRETRAAGRWRPHTGAGPAAAVTRPQLGDSGSLARAGSLRTSRRISAARAPSPVIHLDTSFLIRALVRETPQDRRLREWLRAGERLGIVPSGGPSSCAAPWIQAISRSRPSCCRSASRSPTRMPPWQRVFSMSQGGGVVR